MGAEVQGTDVPLGTTARLYCACPAAIEQSLRDHSTAVHAVSTSTAVFLALLLGCTLRTRSLAAKAKKQKHKRLEAAEGYYETNEYTGRLPGRGDVHIT